MKHKLILIPVMFLLIIGMTFGALTDNLVAYCKMEDASFTEEVNAYDGTNQGSIEEATGIIDKARDYDGVVDYSTFPDNADFDIGTDDFSINVWVDYGLGLDGTRSMIFDKRKAADFFEGYGCWAYENIGDLQLRCQLNDVDTTLALTYDPFEIELEGWTMVTWIVDRDNSSGACAYKNGVLVDCLNPTQSSGTLANTIDFHLAKNSGGANFYANGDIDELAIYKGKVLTYVEIEELYAAGAGLQYPFGGAGGIPPSITLNTSLISHTNSSDNPFSFSIDAIGNIDELSDFLNISVYLNGTLNQTYLNVPNLNSTHMIINFTYGSWQLGYDVNVTAKNSNVSTSFVRSDIFLDSVTPYITFLSPKLADTVYYKGVDTEINISIFCDDPNLFSCNLTLGNTTAGGSFDKTLNNSFYDNIATPNQTAIFFQSIIDLPVGQYMIIGESADSHTALNVGDMEWDWINDELHIANLIFESPDIKILNSQEDLVTYFYKDFDRYKMKVTFESQSLDHEFILTAPEWSFVGDKYGYKGHFVSLAERKWLDFVGTNVANVIVTPQGNDQYLIHVDHDTMTDEIEFESIGDLNINNVTRFFNVTQNTFGFNMFIYNEDTPASSLVGSAEVEFNYYIGSQPNITHYYADLSGADNYAFNITSNESTIRGDLYIKYTTSGGFTHRFILVNTTFNTTVGYNFTLYNFNTTTGISDLKITARQNANYNYYPNVIAKLQRRYTSEGLWRTVQMDQSGDFGVLFFNIREETIDYRIIFTDTNNNILKTTDSLKFVCTDAFCDLTTLLDPYEIASTTANIQASYIYDNASKLINFTWIDPDGGSNTVRMRARQDTVTGAIYPCDTTQAAAASGSLSCNVTGRQGSIEVTVIANGNIILNEWLDITGDALGTEIDEKEGAFWAAIILTVCVTFGLFSPVGAIIAMIIGLIAIFMLGIFTPLTVTFVIIATVISIVIGYKVRT